jgi:signal-transduction protein with cAMP-binding, CBS, and nucleotidyltransferase domain
LTKFGLALLCSETGVVVLLLLLLLLPLMLLLLLLQATLVEVLDKIVSHRIHRVYIVDEQEKPVGVVTCTDVLKLVVKHAHLASKPNSRAQSQFGDSQISDEQQEQQQQQAGQQHQQQQPVSETDVKMVNVQ